MGAGVPYLWLSDMCGKVLLIWIFCNKVSTSITERRIFGAAIFIFELETCIQGNKEYIKPSRKSDLCLALSFDVI
jgi:hypothetical protein